MNRIRRNDTVMVRSGKDRGKQGVVREVLTKKDRVIVDGINMMKKHQRPTQQAGMPVAGSIVTREGPLHVSKVMLVCKECGRPTRVGARVRQDGAKVRVCKRCGADID